MSTLSLSDWLGLIAFLALIGAGLWVGVMCVIDIIKCACDKE